jgi:hypothetical protein
MLTEADPKFWGPIAEVVDWVSSHVPPGARVLEVGPGSTPFPRATHFIGWVPAENVVTVDLNCERLPFPDKHFDFVYCRHVLEDLYNPMHVCSEMSRVARAGYVETPSPGAEICRGIDVRSPGWRGYIHHRYFVWETDGLLSFMGKYPVIEHIDFSDEAGLENALRKDPLLWNTYFLWEGGIRWQHLQHEVDYWITRNYAERVAESVERGLAGAGRVRRLL